MKRIRGVRTVEDIGVKARWSGNLKFVGETEHGSIQMDATPSVGGSGHFPTPMETLLTALAGCTGMDVISILKKMRQEVTDLNIEVIGSRAEEHPRVFTKIEVVYNFKGHNLDSEKIKHAVELSAHKYCPISNMLNNTTQVSHRVKIEKEPIITSTVVKNHKQLFSTPEATS